MNKLSLSPEIKNAPAPSDAYIKSKIINRYKKTPDDLIRQLGNLIKKLCTDSRLKDFIKFVIYQPNFRFEVVDRDIVPASAQLDFAVDLETLRGGSMRIPAHRLNNLLLTPDRFEHEFWHATQFFLHHPPSSRCETPSGGTNSYPFLPLTSRSLNQDWRLLSAVLQNIWKIRWQLEPFLEGPLPNNLDSLPEPSRRLVKGIASLPKSSPYKTLSMPVPEENCLSLRQSPTKQMISESDSFLKIRTVLEPSQCISYVRCSQENHPVCQGLDWTGFAISRIYSYEFPSLNLSLPLGKNLARHQAVFWNALVKWLPESNLMHQLNSTEVSEAMKFEFPISNAQLLSVHPSEGYKLVLKAAKIPPDFAEQFMLLFAQIEQNIRLVLEADTVFMTELGNHIYDIDSYHQISKLHQQSFNKWLGFCSNGTAMIHLPHPEECLNQPARCGESPALPLSINLQSALISLAVGFTMQSLQYKSLQYKISPATVKKLSSALEFCALVAIAGPVLGTLGFAVSESIKFANGRFGRFAKTKVDTAIRALPIAGLFVTSGSNGVVQTGLTMAANFTSAMVGAKLADWTFRR